MADDVGFVHLPPRRGAGETGFTALPPKAKPIDESATGIMAGAVKDLMPGPGGRPGKVSISENRPGEKTPLGVVVNPQNAGESLLAPMITAPAYAAMPGGAVGRIALAAGVGGGSEAARGGGLSQIGLHTILDAAVAGLTEGAGQVIASKGAKYAADATAREAGVKYATEAPQKALDFLRSRLPTGKWVEVPSLSSVKMTAQEAVEKLAKLEGDAYKVAREEIASSFRKLDAQTLAKVRPYADRVFKMMTSDFRVTPKSPSVTERAGKAAMDVASNPAARGVADAAMTGPLPGDATPRGALVAAGAAHEGGDAFRRLLHHFMPAH